MQEIRRLDIRDVALAGKMRLAVGLLAGFELSDVAGYSIAVRQRDDEWASSGERASVEVDIDEIVINQGDEVAIGIGVAADLTDDVRTYLERERIPVRKLVIIRPQTGVGTSAINSAAEARGYANAIRGAVRKSAQDRASALHLFQAAPLGLAVLVGHVWNRTPSTIVYEDMGAGRGYAPTFRFPG